MQDLLNEHDFIEKKKFNPWKRVMICCSIAAIQVVAIYILVPTDSFELQDNIVKQNIIRAMGILNLIFPVILSFWMVIARKEMYLRSLKTIFLSLFSLALTYTLSMSVATLVHSAVKGFLVNTSEIYFGFTAGLVYLLAFCLVVLPVAHYKAKRIKL